MLVCVAYFVYWLVVYCLNKQQLDAARELKPNDFVAASCYGEEDAATMATLDARHSSAP